MNTEMHKAIRLLNDHGLSVISGDQQIKNGTIMVMDDVLGTKYTIHASGYARKRVGAAPMFGPTAFNHYQLNKTRRTAPNKYGWTGVERIKLPGQYVELAKMIANAAYAERKRDIAETSLRNQGRNDSWFSHTELNAEYKRISHK